MDNIQAVPVRGIPRLRTFIGTTRLRFCGLWSIAELKSSGCFSSIVGALDMAIGSQEDTLRVGMLKWPVVEGLLV